MSPQDGQNRHQCADRGQQDHDQQDPHRRLNSAASVFCSSLSGTIGSRPLLAHAGTSRANRIQKTIDIVGTIDGGLRCADRHDQLLCDWSHTMCIDQASSCETGQNSRKIRRCPTTGCTRAGRPHPCASRPAVLKRNAHIANEPLHGNRGWGNTIACAANKRRTARARQPKWRRRSQYVRRLPPPPRRRIR